MVISETEALSLQCGHLEFQVRLAQKQNTITPTYKLKVISEDMTSVLGEYVKRWQ